MRVLYPPLEKNVRSLYENSITEFIIVSPWIKEDALDSILNLFKKIKYRALIIGNLNDFVSGSTDVSAVEKPYKYGAEIGLIENLHAKIYILVDKNWDYPAKSTTEYISLGWKILPWSKIYEINASEKIWSSYEKATKKVIKNPVINRVSKKHIQNKINLKELISGLINS